MPRGNPSEKLAITVDPDVHQDVREAAMRQGVSVSKWMTLAARIELARQRGLEAVVEWEKEHGAFTEEEMREARRELREQLTRATSKRRSA